MDIDKLNLSWGKKNRMAQMFKPCEDGEYRSVLLAVDHPYFYGPTTGLTPEVITSLTPYADAVSPARGTLESIMDPKVTTPLILRISGGNSMAKRLPDGDVNKPELANEHILTPVSTAVKYNTIGVSVNVYIGTDYQAQTLQNLGEAAKQAEQYDLLVLGVVGVGAELDSMRDDSEKFAKYLAHSGRILQEHGADIVKLYYCDGFDEVRDGIQKPLVMAGGKKLPELEAFTMTYNAVQEGVDGIDMGRNIFQAEDPVSMIQAVDKVVKESYTPNEANQFYNELKATQ